MPKTMVQKGSVRGPQGPQGVQGVQGPAGRTLDPEGTVTTKAVLAAKTGMVKGQAWVVAENKHLYVYEGNEAPTSGQPGYDSALPGYTDMGDIQGPKGDTGVQGQKGDTGQTGAQGPQGPKGDTGAQGIQGPKGDTGVQGPQGDRGPTGPEGPRGATGDQGPIGPKGDQGIQGTQGPQGLQGAQGARGSRWFSYGGSTGVTASQALASAAIGDILLDAGTGDYSEVADV